MSHTTSQMPTIPSRPRRFWVQLRQSRLTQGLILMIFWKLGDVVAHATGLPVPGPIFGLFLMLAALAAGWMKLQTVHRGATWFVGEMLLFFVPPVLAVLNYPQFAGWLGVKVLAAIVLGTVVVMTVTAVTIELCYRLLVPARAHAAE